MEKKELIFETSKRYLNKKNLQFDGRLRETTEVSFSPQPKCKSPPNEAYLVSLPLSLSWQLIDAENGYAHFFLIENEWRRKTSSRC